MKQITNRSPTNLQEHARPNAELRHRCSSSEGPGVLALRTLLFVLVGQISLSRKIILYAEEEK